MTSSFVGTLLSVSVFFALLLFVRRRLRPPRLSASQLIEQRALPGGAWLSWLELDGRSFLVLVHRDGGLLIHPLEDNNAGATPARGHHFAMRVRRPAHPHEDEQEQPETSTALRAL